MLEIEMLEPISIIVPDTSVRIVVKYEADDLVSINVFREGMQEERVVLQGMDADGNKPNP